MRRMANASRWALIVGITVATTVISGCGGLTTIQKDAVTKFGDASEKLGAATGAELVIVRDGIVQMNLERLMLEGYQASSRTSGVYPTPTELDHGLNTDAVATISAATQALAAYGKTLVALVADTQTAEVKKAAATFSASLGSVPNSGLSEGQRTAIGDAIEGLGGFLIEGKRKKAIIAVVQNSQNSVNALCDLLIANFEPVTPTSKGGLISRQMEATTEPLYGTAIGVLRDGKTSQARRESQFALKIAFENRVRRTHDLAKVQKAAIAMKKANTALANAIQDSKWSFDDLLDFAEKAESLQAAVKNSVKKGD